MADPEYIGFICDYSDAGTLSVTMDSRVKDEKKFNDYSRSHPNSNTPLLEEVTVTVPLWQALVNDGGTERPVQDKHFCCKMLSLLIENEIFIEKEEFEKRIPKRWSSPRGKAALVYQADWEASKHGDRLSCKGYDNDGLVLGESQADSWPRAGIIAHDPRSRSGSKEMTDRERLVSRYYAQAAIWESVVVTSRSAGSSRLWRPTSWPATAEPLKLYFSPVNSWPSLTLLEKIVDAIREEEKSKEKSNHKSNRRLGLLKWLDWQAVAKSKTKNHVLLSTHLLGLYNTYISKSDLKRLVLAQTQDSADWRRPLPSEDDAMRVHQRMLAALPPKHPHYKRLKAGLKQTSTTSIKAKSFPARIDAKKLMGGVSANQLGKEWWKSGELPSVVAEWLHRSAYSLGPLTKADFQSPDNIVFGTFEANSDMTRAETVIRTLRDIPNAEGSLNTIVINKNLSAQDKNRLNYLDPKTGKSTQWKIPDWIEGRKLTWIAPQLVYKGGMKISKDVELRWTTRFSTFSRYSPLILEGRLDSRLLSEYTENCLKKNAKRLKPSSSSKTVREKSRTLGILESLRLPLSTHEDQLPVPTKSLALQISATPPGGARPRFGKRFDTTPAVAFPKPSLPRTLKAFNSISTHPSTHAAWQSIFKQSGHISLGGVRVENPRLADDGNDIGDPTKVPPSTGFMLEGTIRLFGLDSHKVPLQSWHGPPPPDVEVGSELPVFQRVQLGDIRPIEFIPLLKDTPLSNLEFQNTIITYQNYRFNKTIPIGWVIEGDFVIDKRWGTLYDVLHDVLSISGDGLKLRILVWLGMGHSWTSRPQLGAFSVQGMLQLHPNTIGQMAREGVKLCNNITLTQIGVRVFGLSVPTLGLDSKEEMEYGFKIFGDMHIKVPGSVTPLDLDFEIEEFGGTVGLEATVKGDVWKNAFGVGIDLDLVRLSATFNASAPLTSLDCSLSAHLRAESASASIMGFYTVGGNYSVSAYVENLGCQGVADLFRHHTGQELLLPDHVDITIGSAIVEISKDGGLSISADKLEFDHYTSANATIKLSSNGALVRAEVERIDLPGDLGIGLASAYMQVSFEKQGSNKSTDVALGGKVVFDGIDLPAISAGVHLYKSESKKLQWTIYGTFTDLGNTTTLGQLFPELQGTFLQTFALQDLLFIAASQDDPLVSQMNPQKYPIKKGVQFSALFGQIDSFNKLLRRSSFPGLLLSARWTPGDSFLLDVLLPTNTLIHLGRGITTDPIVLSINTKQLLLQISTGVKVPVPESTIPLDFRASLMIKGESVDLNGEMRGLWRNPFGISKSVAVGPFLELGLGIDLAIFPETGLPSRFSFAGGLSIGETEGQVAVQISELPSQELLSGEIKKFGIRDLVAFVRQITQLNIPTPPDFIDFQDVKLYMSSGVTLGSVTYPAGFSFKAAMLLFGAQLNTSAEVTGGVLKVTGSIDNLSVGPLHITGQHGKKATLDLQVGLTAQRLAVDGAISFLGAYVGLTLDLEILPKPAFSFSFTLNFTHLLTFMVDARMIGNVIDLKNPSGLNFSLHALFEQHLVEHIRDQVIASLEALKHRTDDAIEAAKQRVAEEENKLQSRIDSAQTKLNQTRLAWDKHLKAISAESKRFIDNYVKKLRSLQGSVESERKAFNTKLKNAESAVRHADADRAAKMRAAEAEVTKKKEKWDRDVANAEATLEAAKRDMHRRFGTAEADIEAAKRKVDGIQVDIDSTLDRISYCRHSPWYRFECVYSMLTYAGYNLMPNSLKAELAWLGPKLLVLEGYKVTADGILEFAEAVVKSADYISTKAAIPAAEELVRDAGHAGDLAFRAAQATLREIDRDTGALLHTANSVLESLRKGGDSLLRTAESALAKFITAQKDLLYAAQHAVENLVHSAEWLAYQAASGALDLARHATHALDVAKKALEVAKKVVDGIYKVSEAVVAAALSAFNITRVELLATLDMFLGGKVGGGAHFQTSVHAELLGKRYVFDLKLDMSNPAQLVKDIVEE
ncbi:hypothetical protein FRC09_012899 [Ceratobasidium sp. 395]|nr:hypothetical protein FRC09_012899 [Ceratobasidium sp. 395]